MSPSDLSSREATIVEAGPDAAVDGRMFGALLLRFGRVDGERAVLSLDGEVEGIESGSEARSQVAADIICSVEAGEVPSYCQRCGAPLAGEARAVGQMIGGRHVELRRPLPVCRACAAEPGPRAAGALLAVRRDLPARTRSTGSRTSSRSPTRARASTGTRCRASARARRRLGLAAAELARCDAPPPRRASTLITRTNAISVNAAAQACACWSGLGDSEYVKIVIGIDASGLLGSAETAFAAIEDAKSSGAVSPATRAIARIVDVTMPPIAVGQRRVDDGVRLAGSEREARLARRRRRQRQHLVGAARDVRQHDQREREGALPSRSVRSRRRSARTRRRR